MGRIIGAVIAGYVAMLGVVFFVFSAIYFFIGADRAFRPGSYEPSMLWILIMFVVGFLAAVLGGWVSVKVAANLQGPKWLAVLVIVLGILFALPSLLAKPSKEPRPAGLSNMEAMKKAQTPAWVALSNPVIGVAGVWVGGWRRRGGSAPAAAL